MITKAKIGLMLSEDEGKGYESWNSGDLKKLGKDKKMDSFNYPLEPLSNIFSLFQ